MSGQGLQMFLLTGKLRLVLLIQLIDRGSDEGLIGRHILKVITASQIQSLGDAVFEMAMGRLNRPILVGNPFVVARRF